MLLFKKIEPLQDFLQLNRSNGMQIGYVPTMGALHEGHASLVRSAKAENEICVCSIFVNPTQFNDAKDLEKYPRTEGRDIEYLTELGTDVLFYPGVKEIYPKHLTTPVFDFGKTALVMEGEHRPGHFDGVVQVVHRLLDIVRPDKLYMGQKDFQQFTLIRHMLDQMGSATQLVVCPIIREKDGLALSSRNVRLSAQNRKNAPHIARVLHQLNDWISNGLSLREAEQKAIAVLKEIPEFRPEYLEIVNAYTLEKIDKLEGADYVVACIAVWAGAIRLIDNVILKKSV